MKITGLHQSTIVCGDVQRTLDFYSPVMDRICFKSIYTGGSA